MPFIIDENSQHHYLKLTMLISNNLDKMMLISINLDKMILISINFDKIDAVQLKTHCCYIKIF